VVASLVGRELAGKHTYRVGRVVGQGGTSTVYHGEWLVRGKAVAIKVLHAPAASLEELARRFDREVATAQRIDHPNVVRVLDSGVLPDGSKFMVMELLEGTRLDRVLMKGPLSPARALAISRQVLLALAEAHRIGIIHRDIKPSNVMLVNAEGGGEMVKLFDFGIAANDRAAIKLTAAGTAFGTPEYISPEMAKGQKVDARADLYSLGVMLFEMLTGKLPFERADALDLLRAHISDPPPSPRQLKPDLDRRIDMIVWRALSKDPAERYDSADDMRGAIDSLTGGQGSTGRRVAFFVVTAAAVAAAAFALFRLLG
jgi:serine/threonine-protein kinase